jgi:hypothetical protein
VFSRGVRLIVAGCAVLIAVAGYSAAAFVISTFPTQAGGSGAPSAPAGVSYGLAQAQIVGPTTVPATGACSVSNLGTQASPTNLTNGSNTGICLNTATGGFAPGDTMYVLEVSFSHSALVSHIFQAQIRVSVTPTVNDIAVTAYVRTSAAIAVVEYATFALDMTSAGDTSILQYTLLVTQ